jgi:hypothetical protein
MLSLTWRGRKRGGVAHARQHLAADAAHTAHSHLRFGDRKASPAPIRRASSATSALSSGSARTEIDRPWRTALREARALPLAVRGPVLWRALARLAAVLRADTGLHAPNLRQRRWPLLVNHREFGVFDLGERLTHTHGERVAVARQLTCSAALKPEPQDVRRRCPRLPQVDLSRSGAAA